ncbi:hypothetical protein [Ottowia sp.]|uniref:hypothetical protein n=1 Tax=Ottowia sp. TaxID=1898956 RepID=UPI0025F73FC2|nr:hypothetical protein [Ottowia sp.]
MPEDKTKTPSEADKVKQMTAAEAAKRVKRTVTELVDGKDEDGEPVRTTRTKKVAVAAEEVLAWRDYGTHVVVVTRDGRKLSSADESQ